MSLFKKDIHKKQENKYKKELNLLSTAVLNDANNPLRLVWVAAHWDKKITKRTIYNIIIGKIVNSIIFSAIGSNLRISCRLLLGVVKIYHRKVTYLLKECVEMKQEIGFKPYFKETSAIDLKERGNRKKKKMNKVTMEELLAFTDRDAFNLFTDEVALKDVRDVNMSKQEDITLKELDIVHFPQHDLHKEDEFDKLLFETFTMGQLPKQPLHQSPEPLLDRFLFSPQHHITSSQQLADLIQHEQQQSQQVQLEVNHVEQPKEQKRKDKPDLNVTLEQKSYNRLKLNSLTMSQLKNDQNHRLARKRPFNVTNPKLLVDHNYKISTAAIKEHIMNTTSTLLERPDFAPPTNRAMQLAVQSRKEHLCSFPYKDLHNHRLLELYQANLQTCHEDEANEEDKKTGDTPEKEDLRLQKEEVQVMSPNFSMEVFPIRSSPPVISPLIPTNFSYDGHKKRKRSNNVSSGQENVDPNTTIKNTDMEVVNNAPKKNLTFTIDSSQQIDASKGEKNRQELRLAFRTMVKEEIREKKEVVFSEVLKQLDATSRQSVSFYFDLLLKLIKSRSLRVSQSLSYAQIHIKPGERFENL